MSAINKSYRAVLFIGDIVIFFLSLWLTLLIRYQTIPSAGLWASHIVPFSILFVVCLLVFYIAGLYEKGIIILRNRLPNTIFKAQIANSILAVLFFYFIPYFEITPKTTLFLYLIISFLLLLVWRLYGGSLFGRGRRQKAMLIASGSEMKELQDEVNSHDRYILEFVLSVDLDSVDILDLKREIVGRIEQDEIEIVAVDFKSVNADPILPLLYSLLFSNVIFMDMHKIYEDVFDRIPLSLISYRWFLENISLIPKLTYDLLKRVMDIVISVPLGIISLVLYPFVYVAVKCTDGGPLFFFQERVGKNGIPIRILKFRTMTTADEGEYDEKGKSRNVVTAFGQFLRTSRIDELPQLWNVVKGDLSLIGPRPELPSLVEKYEKEIPYYGIRHLIKPGLSGWAQLYHDNHPHHGVAVAATKEKLSYDLFYIKNRSLILDVTIALKTINKLISRSGI
jgi:exopolysaccharide biosynthesis polyprenyl glycosylphosphotransferase